MGRSFEMFGMLPKHDEPSTQLLCFSWEPDPLLPKRTARAFSPADERMWVVTRRPATKLNSKPLSTPPSSVFVNTACTMRCLRNYYTIISRSLVLVLVVSSPGGSGRSAAAERPKKPGKRLGRDAASPLSGETLAALDRLHFPGARVQANVLAAVRSSLDEVSSIIILCVR